MIEDNILCASSAYNKKFFLNPRFDGLPTQIKEELQIMSVLMTEDVGGIFTMEFDEDGNLFMSVTAGENDFFYDEIGAELKIREYRTKYRELHEQLEQYYRAFII